MIIFLLSIVLYINNYVYFCVLTTIQQTDSLRIYLIYISRCILYYNQWLIIMWLWNKYIKNNTFFFYHQINNENLTGAKIYLLFLLYILFSIHICLLILNNEIYRHFQLENPKIKFKNVSGIYEEIQEKNKIKMMVSGAKRLYLEFIEFY